MLPECIVPGQTTTSPDQFELINSLNFVAFTLFRESPCVLADFYVDTIQSFTGDSLFRLLGNDSHWQI